MAMQTPQSCFLHRDPTMNKTTMGSQPIAGQRHLPQSFQDTDAGVKAGARQPVQQMLALPQLTRQQDKAGSALLDMPGHQPRTPPQAGPERATAGPRLSPPKAEEEPADPACFPAKQSSDERDEECAASNKDSQGSSGEADQASDSSSEWLVPVSPDRLEQIYRDAGDLPKNLLQTIPAKDCVGAGDDGEESSGEAETESDSLPEWLAELAPNARDRTWLRAAGGLNESLIQTMLASKLVDVNARTKDGKTGLHLAIQEGDPDIIRLLLGNARIDINARDVNRRTALHLAVMDYAYESVFDLAGCGRTDVNAEDAKGWTALRWAARHGRKSLVKVLLTAPAIDVNAKDAKGWTALRHAAEGQHVEVIKMLLLHPTIRIPFQAKDGWSILQWAFDGNHCNLIVELIRSHDIEPTLGDKEPRHVFLVAAEQGKTEMVRALLALPGLDVNMAASEEVDSYGDFSALVLASMYGHLEIVQALLEVPTTKVNFGYTHGGTALSFAAHNDHLPVVLRLLAEPRILLANSHNEDYWDLLHWVVEEGHVDVLRAALATEDAANMLTRRGDAYDELTPLGHAVRNHPEATAIIELLLAAPGIENDGEGCEYALAWAAEENHLAATQRLLSLGCAEDPCSVEHALAIAAEKGHMAIVHALLTVAGLHLEDGYEAFEAVQSAVANANVELAHALAAYETFDPSSIDMPWVMSGRTVTLLQALLSGPRTAAPIRHKAAWQALCIAVSEDCADDALNAILDAGCDPIAMLDAADASDGDGDDDDKDRAENENWVLTARETLHDWLLQRAARPGLSSACLHAALQPASSAELENTSKALIAGEHDLDTLTLPAGAFSSRLFAATCLADAMTLGFVLGHYRSSVDENALASEAERMLEREALLPSFLTAFQEFQTLQDNIDRYIGDGHTLLTSAAQAGDLALMEVLIGLGARLNMPAANGDMPLMAAVKAGQWNAAIKLLNLGARHALADRQARSLAFHVCQGFAQLTDSRQADRAATLLEMLLDRNVAFDQVNPDPQSRTHFPTLADLLVSNPQSLVYLASFQGTSMPSGANPARTERLVRAVVDNTGRRGTQQPDRRLDMQPAG
jgi:ankyrin repeat protein